MNSPALQSSEPQPTLHFELEQVDMYGKYLLHSRLEILFVLRAMLRTATPATLFLDHGRRFFVSALVDLDEAAGLLIFEPPADPGLESQALTTGRIVVTTTLEQVKVQFVLTGMSRTRVGGRLALAAALPDRLLRLQRREYFRMAPPSSSPLRCQIPIVGPNAATHILDLAILDLSGGGIGLMVPNEAADYFLPEARFANSRFELPSEGVITSGLVVRTAFPATSRDGHPFARVGVEFVALPGTRLTMIQRYITRIERERKARQSGLE